MGTYLGEVPAAGEPMRVASCVEWLLAPNPSAWTFEGTNTWIVGVPGGSTCAVIDPGPDDARHVEALRRAVGRRSVSTVLIAPPLPTAVGSLTVGRSEVVDGAGAACVTDLRPEARGSRRPNTSSNLGPSAGSAPRPAV